LTFFTFIFTLLNYSSNFFLFDGQLKNYLAAIELCVSISRK
jgi:hypothetical protein